MKLARKKKSLSILVPIASMGDIAFLLIIFFMLTSNFMKESNIKLEKPESDEIEKIEKSNVSVAVDVDGEIYLQGKPCQLNDLKQAVEIMMQEAKKKQKFVTLKIDKNLTQKTYGPILMELSKAGVEIALVGNQIKNKK